MLKITSVTLFKHGLGFFQREGTAQPDFELSFPRSAMDDVLKSLTVVPAKPVVVRGVAFETPVDRNEAARRQPITFDPATPLSGVLEAFSGYGVRVDAGERVVEGRLIGLERETEDHLKRATLAVASPRGVELIRLQDVTAVALTDARSAGDLAFALDTKKRDEDRTSARVRLSAAGDVAISYIAPAPAWRVSYRVLVGPASGSAGEREVFVQGWGLFDNTLEEDLDGVALTLTAGMPVSFRYELHQPNTPERAVVRDEDRTVSAPLEYDEIMGGDENDAMMMPVAASAPRMMKNALSAGAIADSAPVQASGSQRGALFAYSIDAPVSVKRGESGMVPIVAFTASGSRDLIYNKAKQSDHPAASVRFKAGSTTLERGPAIVLVNGHYGGEAVVPFTTEGADVILAFAMELGIVVRSEISEREETVKVRFRDRSVFIDTITYATTTYEATSTLARAETLVVEHPSGYQMTFETQPFEANLSVGRFRLALPARGVASLAVVEKKVSSSYQDVTGLTGQAIQRFLDGKLLDKATAKALEGILVLDAQSVELDHERRALDGERKTIRLRMDDVRKSIAPLTAETDAALRARFVAQLAAHDDAMLALDARERVIIERIATLKADIAAAADKLSS